MKWYHILLALVVICLYPALFGVGYYKGRSSVLIQEPDTITIYKEKTAYRPKEVATLAIGTVAIPAIMVSREDSVIYSRDTVFVEVEREQKRYHEDNLYDCWVSGIQVELDSIKVMQKETIITMPPPKLKQNSVFLRAGAGYYGGIATPITINYARDVKFARFWGGAGYDIVQKRPIAQVGVDLSFRW